MVVFSEDYDRLVTNAGIEGVSEAAVQFILDASNPNNAGTGLGYLQSSFQSGISVASVAPATRVLYNPQMKSSYNFVPGIMGLIFILICAMMTSVSIVREKETAIRPRSTDVGFDGWFSRAFFALFGAFAGIRIVYFYNG